jgi:uncharacterized protein YlzI (FlbEa/FlbD family)
VKIVYTQHAEDRLRKRIIKKTWIERALKRPDKLRRAKSGKKIVVKRINSEVISVVYAVENGNIIVITVYWGE